MRNYLKIAAIITAAVAITGCASNQHRQSQGQNQYNQAQQCEPNYGAAVVGGLIGAVVGSRFGKGHGNEAAIAVGAGAGAVAGSQYGCP